MDVDGHKPNGNHRTENATMVALQRVEATLVGKDKNKEGASKCRMPAVY